MIRTLTLAALAAVLGLACSGATAPEPPAPSAEPVAEAPAAADPAHLADRQGATLAEHAAGPLGARRALVLYHRDLPAAATLQQAFTARFEELDGQVLARWRFAPAGLDAATRAVVEMLPLDVVVVAAGPDETIPAIRGLRSVGYSGVILGGAGFDGVAWSEQPNWGHVAFAAPEAGGEVALWRVEDRAKTPVAPPL